MSSETESIGAQKAANKTLSFNVDSIASSKVFSNGANHTAAIATTVQSQQTQGDEYLLQAIFESTQASRSRAIISVAGSMARSYLVGDEIKSGVTVDSIERNRVLLNTPRGIESLGFRAPALASLSQASSRSIELNSENEIDRSGSNLELQGSSASSKMDSVRQRLQQLREQSRAK